MSLQHIVTERSPLPSEIASTRVIAIARGLRADAVLAALEPLVSAGIRAIEVTLDSPDALATITACRERAASDVVVGAGTVLTEGDAQAALAAGAAFLVAPGFSEETVRAAVEARVPVFPGAFTPTEVIAAWEAGATAVKLFPAGGVGPGYLKDVRGPLRHIPLIPTGGIGEANIGEFLAAGAVAVAVGGSLFSSADPVEIGNRAARLVRLAAAA